MYHLYIIRIKWDKTVGPNLSRIKLVGPADVELYPASCSLTKNFAAKSPSASTSLSDWTPGPLTPTSWSCFVEVRRPKEKFPYNHRPGMTLLVFCASNFKLVNLLVISLAFLQQKSTRMCFGAWGLWHHFLTPKVHSDRHLFEQESLRVDLPKHTRGNPTYGRLPLERPGRKSNLSSLAFNSSHCTSGQFNMDMMCRDVFLAPQRTSE